MRIHSADEVAPAGSNSATGWILRVIKNPGTKTGDWVMNAKGEWMRWAQAKLNQSVKNDVHIPIQNQAEDPTSPFYDDPARMLTTTHI